MFKQRNISSLLFFYFILILKIISIIFCFINFQLFSMLNKDSIQPTKLTNQHFYKNLKIYKSFFYYGKGQPIFMINQKWYSSFFCVLLSCSAYVFCIWFFSHYTDFKKQEEYSPRKTVILTGINIFMLTGMIITYFMTQCLNPGIKNPDTLTEQEFKQYGKKQCVYCQKQVLQKMFHCNYCQVCIFKKHHHCGFFQRCMGGNIQAYGFKFFLFFAFMSCMTLFITMMLYLV